MILSSLTLAGIVLPSMLLVIAVRRWLEPVSWRMGALFLGLALVFVARGVFTSGMPVPLDEVVRGYPYRGVFGDVTARNYLTNDTSKQVLPWMKTVRDDFAHGRAPLWNPYLFCGYPLLGNGQSAPFSPFFVVTLFVPLPKQMVAMAGLKLFTALLFGFLLARREGVSDAAAVLASAVFAFAIFNNCFMYYPMTAVTLLLPVAAYGVLLCLMEDRGAPFVLVTLVVAALLAGGHPESVVHVVIAVLVMAAVEWLAPQWTTARYQWRDLRRVTGASILGLLLSAPAWLPVLEQVLISLRMHLLQKAASNPFPAKALWAMLNPDGYGNPAHGNWSWYLSYTHVASLYLGLIVTALLPCAFSRRAVRRDRLLIAAAAIFFLISMNWTFIGRMFSKAPVLSWVAHDRLRFAVCFLAGLIAARALSRNERVIPAAAASVLVVLGAYVFVRLLGRTLTPISATGLVCLVTFIGWSLAWPRAASMAACLLTIAELFVFTFDYNSVSEARYYVPPLPILEALRAYAPGEPFRVLGFDWVLLPNAAEQYGLEDVRGSDPMEWWEYAQFFRTLEVVDTSIDVKRIVEVDRAGVDLLNVRFLLTEPSQTLSGKWKKLYGGRDGDLYENQKVLPRFFAPQFVRRVSARDWADEVRSITDFGAVSVVSGRFAPAAFENPRNVRVDTRRDRHGRFILRVEAPAEAVIASSQPAMRWWRVRVNGKRTPTFRANGVFLGFRVPAGVSRVVVEYVPWPFHASVFVAIAAAAGLAGLVRRKGDGGAAMEAEVTGQAE
jgi:hypothetical protein